MPSLIVSPHVACWADEDRNSVCASVDEINEETHSDVLFSVATAAAFALILLEASRHISPLESIKRLDEWCLADKTAITVLAGTCLHGQFHHMWPVVKMTRIGIQRVLQSTRLQIVHVTTRLKPSWRLRCSCVDGLSKEKAQSQWWCVLWHFRLWLVCCYGCSGSRRNGAPLCDATVFGSMPHSVVHCVVEWPSEIVQHTV